MYVYCFDLLFTFIEFLVFGCSFEGKAVVTNDTSTFFVRAERLPDPQLPTTYTPTYTPLLAPSPSPQVLGAGTPSTQRLAYVSIRQHTSAYVSRCLALKGYEVHF